MAFVKEIVVNGILTQVTEFDHQAQEIDDTVDGHKVLREEFNDFKTNGELKPTAHAATHAVNGSDPITPASIGAYSKDETYNKEEVDRIASAGGGLLPQIIVTSDPGSTVTCTKGEITLTAEEVGGVWSFDVPEYGEWTVTAQRYEFVNDATVLVDSVKQYTATVYIRPQNVNHTKLYHLGDECEDVTGGWNTTTSGSAAAQKQESCVFLDVNHASSTATMQTNNALNYSDYSRVDAYVDCSATITGNYNKPGYAFGTTNLALVHVNTPIKHITLDVASTNLLTDGKPLIMQARSGGQVACTVDLYVYNITMFKVDDISQLLQVSGLTAGSISELLDQSQALLANHKAVVYMLYTCTGDFMAQAIQSEKFLTALEASPYKELVYADQTWGTYLGLVV